MKIGHKRILYMVSTRGNCGVIHNEYYKRKKHRNNDRRVRKALMSKLRHKLNSINSIPIELPDFTSEKWKGYEKGVIYN